MKTWNEIDRLLLYWSRISHRYLAFAVMFVRLMDVPVAPEILLSSLNH